MAFIILKNKQHRIVSAEQGNLIWNIMQGDVEGTPEQQNFVKLVKKVYLNRTSAPTSYINQFYSKYRRLEPAGNVRLPYAD